MRLRFRQHGIAIVKRSGELLINSNSNGHKKQELLILATAHG
jgi:hypothetical protein